MEFINLIGSEAVERAGHNIARAAEEMSRAASTISETEQMLVRDMERTFGEWVDRIQEVLHPMLEAKAQPLPTYPDIEKVIADGPEIGTYDLRQELRNILGIPPDASIPPAIMILQANLKAAKADLGTMTKRAEDAEKVGEQKNDLLGAAVREVEAQRKLVGTLQTEITTLVAHEQEWFGAWKGVPAEDPADLRRQFDAMASVAQAQAVTINELESQVAGLEAQHEQDEKWCERFCALARAHGWNLLDGSVYDWIAAKLNAHAEAQVKILGADSLARALNTANAEVDRLRTVEAEAEISDTERRGCQARAEAAEGRLKEYEGQHRESLACWEDMENRAESAEARVKDLEAKLEGAVDCNARMRAAQQNPAEMHLCISDPEGSGKVFYVRGLAEEGIKVVKAWKDEADMLAGSRREVKDQKIVISDYAAHITRLQGELDRARDGFQEKLDLQWEAVKAVEAERDALQARLESFEQAIGDILPPPTFQHWHSDAYRARELDKFATTMRTWLAQERAARADLIKVAVLAERERIAAMLDREGDAPLIVVGPDGSRFGGDLRATLAPK